MTKKQKRNVRVASGAVVLAIVSPALVVWEFLTALLLSAICLGVSRSRRYLTEPILMLLGGISPYVVGYIIYFTANLVS